MVFTEYAETLDWIVRVLGQHGYRDGRELAVIQGSTPAEEREYIRAKFTAPPDKQPVRVLVATDSAGRGHRPAGLLPPAGELRHPVQPVPA